jgi:hypothetical protein
VAEAPTLNSHLHFGLHDALLDASAAVGRGMPLSLETKTMTLGELFSGSNVFRMPIFQRPYSWDEETALELYDDIDQMLNEPLATFWVQ